MKKFCNTHSFYYSGVECPCCLQDRLARLSKAKGERIEKKKEEPTEEALNNLLAKFNKH